MTAIDPQPFFPFLGLQPLTKAGQTMKFALSGLARSSSLSHSTATKAALRFCSSLTGMHHMKPPKCSSSAMPPALLSFSTASPRKLLTNSSCLMLGSSAPCKTHGQNTHKSVQLKIGASRVRLALKSTSRFVGSTCHPKASNRPSAIAISGPSTPKSSQGRIFPPAR